MPPQLGRQWLLWRCHTVIIDHKPTVHLLPPHNFYQTQVRSLSFLVPQSEVLLLNFVQIAIFVNVVKIDTRISPWLLNGFLKIVTWIFQSCYMDLFKLLHGLVL